MKEEDSMSTEPCGSWKQLATIQFALQEVMGPLMWLALMLAELFWSRSSSTATQAVEIEQFKCTPVPVERLSSFTIGKRAHDHQ